jgi:phospholipid transport system substrate-binding protein
MIHADLKRSIWYLRSLNVLSVLLLSALCWSPILSAQTPANDPAEITRQTVNEVMTEMKQNEAVYSKDNEKLNAMVQQRLLPLFNFKVMTQLAVGRSWMQATPEQKSALANEFRSLLVRTYTNVLFGSRNQSTTIESTNTTSQGDVSIGMEVSNPTGDPVTLTLRMRKDQADWKVIDVSVNGVSLIVNYRTTFAREIQQSGVDGLIKSLVTKNRENAL